MDFANFEKNILKKYLKIASKYYIIYIEKRKRKIINRMPTDDEVVRLPRQ